MSFDPSLEEYFKRFTAKNWYLQTEQCVDCAELFLRRK